MAANGTARKYPRFWRILPIGPHVHVLYYNSTMNVGEAPTVITCYEIAHIMNWFCMRCVCHDFLLKGIEIKIIL